MPNAAKSHLTPGLILAIVFGALLAGYALTVAILEVTADAGNEAAVSGPITVGEIEVAVKGKTLRLKGRAPDTVVVQQLIDVLLAATPANAVINRVQIDPTATPPTDLESAAAEIRLLMLAS